MESYLIHKNKIINREDNRLPMIALNSSQNHLQLKWGWHKDASQATSLGIQGIGFYVE